MENLFNEDGFTDKFDQYQPRTLQSVADHIVDYVRQKRPVGASGRLGLVVDVGCSTGQNTYVYADHFDRVLAIDSSESMIRKAVELNVAPKPANVEFAVSTAEDLSVVGVRDGSVDLLTAAFALEWFDLAEFFAEARRVLAPDGVLAVLQQKFEPFHPTDANKSERLRRLKSDILKKMPRAQDPRVLMARSLFRDVDFPLDDFRRECVATTVQKQSIARLRLCFRHSLLVSGEPAERLAAILKSSEDRLMDVDDDDQGRHGNPETAMVHFKRFHWVILGRMNGRRDRLIDQEQSICNQTV